MILNVFIFRFSITVFDLKNDLLKLTLTTSFKLQLVSSMYRIVRKYQLLHAKSSIKKILFFVFFTDNGYRVSQK